MRVIVVDGQGGGIGRALCAMLAPAMSPRDDLYCAGSNALATAAMIKAGASRGATGENAIVWAAAHADIIVGPIAIILAGSMMGEWTPRMAQAIGESEAVRFIVPTQRCNTNVAGIASDKSLQDLLEDVVGLILARLPKEA